MDVEADSIFRSVFFSCFGRIFPLSDPTVSLESNILEPEICFAIEQRLNKAGSKRGLSLSVAEVVDVLSVRLV